MSDFEIKVSKGKSGIPIVAVTGPFDGSSAQRVQQHLLELSESGRHNLLIDLSKTSGMDSIALGVLFGGLKRAREENGNVVIVSTEPKVLDIFRNSGAVKYFDIFDTVENALEAMVQPAPTD